MYKYKTLLLVLYVQCMLQQLKANPFMVKLQVPGKNFPEGSGFPQIFTDMREVENIGVLHCALWKVTFMTYINFFQVSCFL